MRSLLHLIGRGLVAALVISRGSGLLAAEIGAARIRTIGSQVEPLLDDWAIERMTGVHLALHPPVTREVVLRFDSPWEGPMSAYASVLRDGKTFRMYYRGGGDRPPVDREYTCLAESNDGIHWTKPALGLFEFHGSKANNIIWTAREKSYRESHNFAPFKDENPASTPGQRYKAVALGRTYDQQKEGHRVLLAMVSPDGIHWKRLRDEPVMTEGSFDSLNTVFWDSVLRRYVCYLREGREGKRSVQRCTSADFIHWSKPQWLDFGETPLEQFYTNGITPYFRNPHLYIGLPMRFVPERKTIGAESRKIDGLSDGVFMSSRDGLHFSRSFMEAFIRPGLDPNNWGNAHGNNTPLWGILPTGEAEISVYWMEHYGGIPQVRRGTIRTDGFTSVNAPYRGGEMVTRPLIFEGKRLAINYSTSAVGNVKVEIQDAGGKPIPGFELEAAGEIYGDELARVAGWKGGADVGKLAGRPVRLRFVMKDADLFSFCFQP